MIKLFKVSAILEGISTILLFFGAMPLKYIFDNPQFIKPTGMFHGILFIAYIILAFLARDVKKWNTKDFTIILTASLIPLATFYVDKKYLKHN